ncbi:hypothetical protein BT69DRAFT_1319808 [Atractiella rhizophila]|nr:hypothetical protein BT69DRAFT_1319808 [Atractiella rhizophila]
MNPQQWGYGQPQQQRYGQPGLGVPQGLQPQMTGFAPGGLQPQPTGMYPMQAQPTGFQPGGLRPSFAPPVPPMPSQFQVSAAPPVPSFPPRFGGGGLAPQAPSMMAQPTGFAGGFGGGAMASGSGFRALAPTFMNTFLPANPQQASMPANQMQFAHQVQAPNAPSLQQSFQQFNQQQSGTAQVPVPWALTKEEKKNYDQIFRAWDQPGSGFISGETAKEVFGQSGLPRDDLMAIWYAQFARLQADTDSFSRTLSDVDNRGKLNQAEFHVAMGLIYRRLNGNPIPQQLPAELIPPSSRDIEGSVDFLKGLLSKDTNVRATSATGYREGDAGKSRSFYSSSPQPQDGSIYRHNDSEATTYKSRDRHIDRRAVRTRGDDSADGDLAELRRGLDSAQDLLDSSKSRSEQDDELKQEISDLKYRIKRVQEDIEYITRSGRRTEANETERRKLERELTRLKYEQLPDLERRMEAREKEEKRDRMKYGMERDERNRREQNRFAEQDRSGSRSSYDDYGSRGSYDTKYEDRERGSYRSPDTERSYEPSSSRNDDRYGSTRTPPPVAAKPAAPSPAPRPTTPAASSKPMSAEERQAYIRSEAQKRVQERLKALGVGGSERKQDSMDSSVTQRLEKEAQEAAAKAAQADRELAEREKQRQEKLAKEKQKSQPEEENPAAKPTPPPAPVKASPKPKPPPPKAAVRTPAPQPVEDEEDKALREQEEALKRRKAEREARMKRLQEEEEEERQKEEAAEQMRKNRQMFAEKAKAAKAPAPPAPRSKVAPPPPTSRNKAAPPAPMSRTPSVPAVQPIASPPVSIPTPPAPPPVPAISPPSQAFSPPVATPSPPVATSNNPFHKIAAGESTSPAPAMGPNNPFFRSSAPSAPSAPSPVPAATSPFPAPTAIAPPPAPPAVSPVPARKVTVSSAADDDWDADETGSNESSDDEGAIKKRNFRANLANKIFGGGSGSPVPESPNVSTPTRNSSTPIPEAPASSIPAAPPPPPPMTSGVPPAPAAPAAPAPPPPPTVNGGGGGGDGRGALLSQIQGGLRLKKAVTNDRSAAGVSGKVIGDPSPPVQKYVPPPSPPTPPLDAVEPPLHSEDSPADAHKRQSVDWYNSLASSGLSPITQPPRLETTVEEPEEQVGLPSIQVDSTAVDTDEFDMTTVIKSRALYAFDGQREEELTFAANVIIFAHPAKDPDSDWWYGSTFDKSKSGQFPKTYVERAESIGKATALYAYPANSEDEVTLEENEVVLVLDNNDADWWRVEKDGITGLVPATYLELGNGNNVMRHGKPESAGSTSIPADSITNHREVVDSRERTADSPTSPHQSSLDSSSDEEEEDEAESNRRAEERLQVLRAAGILQKNDGEKRRPPRRPAPPIRTRQETLDVEVDGGNRRRSVISLRENDDLEDAYTRYQELLSKDLPPPPSQTEPDVTPPAQDTAVPLQRPTSPDSAKAGDKLKGWLGLGRPPSVGSSTLARPSITVQNARPSSSAGSTLTMTWSSVIDQSALESIPDKERRRQEAIFEFIATEQSYLKSLQLLMEVFFTGLHGLLPAKATEVIFGGIDEILMFDTAFLSSLEDRQREHRMYIDGIGDVIEEHISGIAVYRNYCVNQGNAARVLSSMKATNPSIKDRVDSLSVNGLQLEHYLLNPFQRLTKLPLLISAIIRFTDEESFDYPLLSSALKQVESVLTMINESVRDQEDLEKLLAISSVLDFGIGPDERLDLTLPTKTQGRRRLLREVPLTKGKKKLKGYLFNDLLLISEAKERIELVWLGPLPLEEISFREMARDNLSIELQHRGDNFRLKTLNSRSRMQLMRDLDSARTECIKALNRQHSRISSRTSIPARDSIYDSSPNRIPDFSGI